MYDLFLLLSKPQSNLNKPFSKKNRQQLVPIRLRLAQKNLTVSFTKIIFAPAYLEERNLSRSLACIFPKTL